MTKVLIDADPGTDDALALIMALNSPDVDVAGVTTVGGNATLAHTTRNALRVLEYLHRPDVPVHRGSARPLTGRSYRYGYHYHGAAGLGVRLPSPKSKPHPMRALDFIRQVVSAFPQQITIVALGPLTNIARTLALEPQLAGSTSQIVVMGGAVGVPGNVSPYAEFNIYNDPVAAEAVMSSGIPVTLVPLDVCTKTFFTRGESPWVPSANRAARLAQRVLESWFGTHLDRNRYDLCDPLAVVTAVQPGLLTYRQAQVSVETGENEQRGRTVARFDAGPVNVAVGVDVEAAKSLMRHLMGGEG